MLLCEVNDLNNHGGENKTWKITIRVDMDVGINVGMEGTDRGR